LISLPCTKQRMKKPAREIPGGLFCCWEALRDW